MSGQSVAGGLSIKFSSPVTYQLPYCENSSYKSFPNPPPSTTDKVWRVTVDRSSGIRFKLDCNDVEVLNVIVDDSGCWNTMWKYYYPKTIDGFWISSSDTASDFYRASGTIVVHIS
jgi:hypothetical protein